MASNPAINAAQFAMSAQQQYEEGLMKTMKSSMLSQYVCNASIQLIWVVFFAKGITYDDDDEQQCVFTSGNDGKLEPLDHKLQAGEQDMFKQFDDRAMFGLIVSGMLLGSAIFTMASIQLEAWSMLKPLNTFTGLTGLASLVFWIMAMVTSFSAAG